MSAYDHERKAARLAKMFDVARICRYDLAERLGEEQALALTDDQMFKIAEYLGEAINEAYHDALNDLIGGPYVDPIK